MRIHFTCLVTILILNSFAGLGQNLFFQDTYKGGIASDGKSYFKVDYLSADTISFLCSVPGGSTIRKAFLISNMSYFFSAIPDSVPRFNNPTNLIFNGVPIAIDSNDVASKYFHCDDSNPSGKWGMVIKDVTPYALFNNKLITPCQSCNITNKNWDYVCDGFLLVILYENNSMPVTNAAIFLNDKTYYTSNTGIPYVLSGLNPIDVSHDVGLSLWANELVVRRFTMNFHLQSSLGSYYLGDLYSASYDLISIENHHLPGSFYYQNKTLYGLDDDLPNPTIDSTDALANIKNYISPGTTSFTVFDSAQTNPLCEYMMQAFLLAYSSPCPAIANPSTLQTYTICNGKSVLLAAQTGGNYTYSWQPASTLSDTAIVNPLASPTITTNYIVAITDSNGCNHTQQHKVSVFNNPVPTSSVQVSPDSCSENKAAITACLFGDGLSPHSFSLGSGFQASPVFNNLGVGNYTLTVTNSVGCTYQQQPITVTNINPANALITADPNTGGAPLNVNFSNYSTHTNHYTWSVNGNTFNSFNLNYTFNTPGTYTVTMTAEYDNHPQCSATAFSRITVLKDSFSIVVPNIFTPNKDGINDVWYPTFNQLGFTISTYDLSIFDRWGLKIFESSDLNIGWDGRSMSNSDCAGGTYYYLLRYSANSNTGTEQQLLKGFIQLVR